MMFLTITDQHAPNTSLPRNTFTIRLISETKYYTFDPEALRAGNFHQQIEMDTLSLAVPNWRKNAFEKV